MSLAFMCGCACHLLEWIWTVLVSVRISCLYQEHYQRNKACQGSANGKSDSQEEQAGETQNYAHNSSDHR